MVGSTPHHLEDALKGLLGLGPIPCILREEKTASGKTVLDVTFTTMRMFSMAFPFEVEAWIATLIETAAAARGVHYVAVRTDFEARMDTRQMLARASGAADLVDVWVDTPYVRLVGRDLRGAQFRRASLNRVIFVRCDLERANFDLAKLNGPAFIDCNLTRASFNQSRAGSAFIESSVLREAQFRCDWWEARIETSDFRDAAMNDLELVSSSLRDVDMRRVDLQNAILRATRFSGVDLTDADLKLAELPATRFTDCKLVRTNFDRAEGNVATYFRDVDLTDIDLNAAARLYASSPDVRAEFDREAIRQRSINQSDLW